MQWVPARELDLGLGLDGLQLHVRYDISHSNTSLMYAVKLVVSTHYSHLFLSSIPQLDPYSRVGSHHSGKVPRCEGDPHGLTARTATDHPRRLLA